MLNGVSVIEKYASGRGTESVSGKSAPSDCGAQSGLPEKGILSQDVKEVREQASQLSGEGFYWHNQQPVQGPWGRSVPGLFEEQVVKYG